VGKPCQSQKEIVSESRHFGSGKKHGYAPVVKLQDNHHYDYHHIDVIGRCPGRNHENSQAESLHC
jgi:hypothetical protein